MAGASLNSTTGDGARWVPWRLAYSERLLFVPPCSRSITIIGGYTALPHKTVHTVKSVLRRVIVIAATLVMLAFYSETELGEISIIPRM